MARIRAKKKKNGIYYYLVESRRSGPKKSPREHILEYIGTVENLVEFATRNYNLATADKAIPEGLTFKSYEHGAEIAVFNTARLLGVEEIFSRCFKPRKLKGLSRNISSQTIWEAMDGITVKQIQKAQEINENSMLHPN